MEIELSIANLSNLSGHKHFLLQVSKNSGKLTGFLKTSIPKNEKEWLADFESWKISNKWIKDISDICISEYDQVFFDIGDDLYDLKEEEGYSNFRNKVLRKILKNNTNRETQQDI
jgi:hypothetical protein